MANGFNNDDFSADGSISGAQLNIDNIRIDGNTISSTDTNGNINITPDGTGLTLISATSFTDLDVDNLNLDGNTISSTDTNGDVIITPNGTGDIDLDGTKWPQTSGTVNYALFTDGTDQASWEAMGWELLETQTVSGSPTSLDFTTGFDSKYTMYACEISGIGGSTDSYGIWNVTDDGFSTEALAQYATITPTYGYTSSTDISVSTTNGGTTAKRALIVVEFNGISDGNGPLIRGFLINSAGTNGSFYGFIRDTTNFNGIRYKQAAGTLSGGDGRLYGKR